MVVLTNTDTQVILFAAFGSLFGGYGLSVIVATLGQPTWYSSLNIDPTSSHATAIIGAANGVFFAGGFFGCLVSAYAVEKLGRLNGLRLAAVIGIIGAAIQTGAVNQGMVSRLITLSNKKMLILVQVSGSSCHHWSLRWSSHRGNADILRRGCSSTFARAHGWCSRLFYQRRICTGSLDWVNYASDV